jgi:hypothetical protein
MALYVNEDFMDPKRFMSPADLAAWEVIRARENAMAKVVLEDDDEDALDWDMEWEDQSDEAEPQPTEAKRSKPSKSKR